MPGPGRPEKPAERNASGQPYRGSLIRELRQKKGLSRKRMANLLGCDPDSLSKVETNGVNASKQMLSKIADVLEFPLEDLKQAPVHPRILNKTAETTSTAFRSALTPSHQEIMMQRIQIAEKRIEDSEKMLVAVWQNLQVVRGEIRELKALTADMQCTE